MDAARAVGGRRATPVEYEDTSVPWKASLIQPETMLEGSTQPVVVDVSGPIDLDVPIVMQIGQEEFPAEWSDDVGQQRRCVATAGPRAGRHRVFVVLEVGGESTILLAGKLVVFKR